jgi:hypothetical protein
MQEDMLLSACKVDTKRVGLYTVVFTVTDASGAVAAASRTVRVFNSCPVGEKPCLTGGCSTGARGGWVLH